MNKKIVSVLVILCFLKSTLIFASQLKTQGISPVDLVNPLMGTKSSFKFSHGNTYPAIALPWGMNFWSPQTGENSSGWMYCYQDSILRGFRQTHQPSPWINDYGTFSILPTSGSFEILDKKRGVNFSHSNEIVAPHYYQVLTDDGTLTRISPTNSGAIFNVVFKENQKNYLVIDAFKGGSKLSIDTVNQVITGYTQYNHGGVPNNFANYFIIKYNKSLLDFGTVVNGTLVKGRLNAEHDHVCAYLEFDNSSNDTLNLRVASSFISIEQATLNLERELGLKNIEQIKRKAAQKWNNLLGRIEIKGGDENQQKIFYSCLYRVLLFPRSLFELDINNNPIYYSVYDGNIHSGYQYTDNGFWDTFRAVHPLISTIYPEISSQIMQSLVNAYEESGFLPEWASPGHRNCMIGNNSLSLITDAYLKGINQFDTTIALKAMIHQTHAEGKVTSLGRDGYRDYDSLGYVSYPSYSEATAKTLEYAYADWCLARYAEKIGEDSIAAHYYEKALNYKNVYDSSVGFMRGRTKDGSWLSPFDATEWGGPFTEGCAWHYSGSVMHDIQGLMNIMGGKEVFAQHLDSLFNAPNIFNWGTYGFEIHEISEMVALNMGQYAHGNQPIQHLIYLYNYCGKPWLSQYHARNVMQKLYHNAVDGYCGDEDNGQTSAWYVFSAMGFYPVCPGSNEFVLGSPLFDEITLHLPNDKEFIIDVHNNSYSNYYVKKVRLNNKRFLNNYISYDQVMNGGRMKIFMSEKPNKRRGVKEESFPYSMSPLQHNTNENTSN